MKEKTGFLLHTILPGLVGLLTFFSPNNLPINWKILITISFAGLYFLIQAIILQNKLNKTQTTNVSLNTENNKLRGENEFLNRKLNNYDDFVHKRRLFIDYDLKELSDLVIEYEVHVKDTYRGLKNQVIRNEAGSVKKKTLEIINKEKRAFDEQIFHVQSNKDNR